MRKYGILFIQWGIDHQKHSILLILGTFSLGGCRGHPMTPKLNLKKKDQMSRPDEYTDIFKSNLTCMFLSLRAKLKNKFCPRALEPPHFFMNSFVCKNATSIIKIVSK